MLQVSWLHVRRVPTLLLLCRLLQSVLEHLLLVAMLICHDVTT